MSDAELSKEYWKLKELKAKPQVQVYVLKNADQHKEQIFVIYV